MIVLLDHDDSFVHTLARYVEELGLPAAVVRARAVRVADLVALAPSHIILSPGPCTPAECPVALDVVRTLGATVPILGVCLGHQCVAAAFGARVERSAHPRHGSASPIRHDGIGVFTGLPSPLQGARYHSLAVVASSLSASLTITATADDGEVMGIRHRDLPIEGVQFHPESVLTEWGHAMLANFLGVTTAMPGPAADGFTPMHVGHSAFHYPSP